MMDTKLYSTRNVLSSIGHYAGQMAVGAGALALAPFLAIGGAAYAAGKWGLTLAVSKYIFENELEPHPDVHDFSPNLGKMVKELYKASGLDTGKYPIYSFKPRKRPTAQSGNGGILDKMEGGLSTMRKIPNAAAFHLEKPVIMISEPLLKLLGDDEEHAVLAHEFAHAAAKHQHLSLPHSFLANAAKITGNLASLVEFIKIGFAGAIATASASVGSGILGGTQHKYGDLLFKKDENLSLPEKHAKSKAVKLGGVFGLAAGVGVATYYNTQFLPVWAAAKTISTSSKLLVSNFSKSMEYQADKGAVTFGADPLSLIRSLRKIDAVMKRSLAKEWGNSPIPEKGMLSKIWNNLNATHPTLNRRIARLSDMARKQGISEGAIASAVNDNLDISHADDIPSEIIQSMAIRLNGKNAYNL